MKPSEKAKEIYGQMKGFRVKNSHRKKCALVCVNEIVKVLYDVDDTSGIKSAEIYWQEVKSEIGKL